ncbi:putative ligninase h2 [Diaporthe ampelina]|uniref:Peroxidase n=1 Tax=Diaporthe ampelina TaxID=1214573 RepID=A0A0G2FIV2_9PEZI|nr:putative ligninase h2 [Diaporthe ampelina]
MKFSAITSACAGAAFVGNALAHPGMAKVVDEIKANIMSRQGGPVDPAQNSNELIGDLVALQDSQLTPVGKDIKAVILNQANGESLETYPNVPRLGTPQCKADTCCVWQYVANEMVTAFKGPSGRCTNAARAAVRLGFHDSAGWSKNTGPDGGADGSLILNAEEIRRPGNRGLEEIVTLTQTWFNKYKGYGISAADLIQMGANVATVVCPLGPRTKTYIGRKDNSKPAPDGLLPPVDASADFLIKLFQDKTIQPNGLVALLGAHSTAQQRFVDPRRAGDPQDSTPGVWDMLYYNETINPNAPARVFKFASDIKLAADPRMSRLFTAFAAPNNAAQRPWNLLYAREYVRLSLLGVNNINSLTDCTKVLPQPVGNFVSNDRCEVKTWMSSTKNVPAIANALLDGKLITSVPGLSGLLSSILGGLFGLIGIGRTGSNC